MQWLGGGTPLTKPVTHAAHGADPAGSFFTQLGTKAPDVDVDRSGAAEVVVPPHG